MGATTPTERKLDEIIDLLRQINYRLNPPRDARLDEVLNLPWPLAALQTLAREGYTLERNPRG